MDDLISRQAAIDKLKEHRALYCDNTPDTFSILFYAEKIRVDELDTVIATLVNLPSTQPEIEPKTGHWIEEAKTYYEELKKRSLGVDEYMPYFTDDIACSECLAKYSVLDNETQFFKYCPNCGAKMEGE